MWWMFLIVDVASKCPSCLCSTSNQLNIPSFPPCDYVNTQHFPKENINIGPVLYQGSFHQDTVGSNAPQLVQGSATSINFVIAGHFTWLRVVIWSWTRLGMLASCPLVTGIQDARSFCFGPWFALLGGKSTTSHTSLHITDITLLQQISRTPSAKEQYLKAVLEACQACWRFWRSSSTRITWAELMRPKGMVDMFIGA